MKHTFCITLSLLIILSVSIGAKQFNTQRIDGGFFTISMPETGWEAKKNLPDPYLLVLLSKKENKGDIFRDNIVIYKSELKEGETLDALIKNTIDTAKIKRPDFKVVEDSFIKAGNLKVRRQVCVMTFPEFVSKNIQYFIQVEKRVYVLVASIPQTEFSKWAPIFDSIVKSFKLKIEILQPDPGDSVKTTLPMSTTLVFLWT